ncbi:MAG: Tetratricopeptide 2 repeat protein [Chthoniobacteraceae bacterium]|nr:Tetratricopeptide 2 repeat protein [Chthoniobacteraceae bacterium]
MRQLFLFLIASLGIALMPVHAEPSDPADEFLSGYLECQKGDKAEKAGSFSAALKSYKQAIAILDQLAAHSPDWQPVVVKRRRELAAEGLARVRPQAGKAGDKPIEEEIPNDLPANGLDGQTLIPDELTQRGPNPRGPRMQPGNTRPPAMEGDPLEAIRTQLQSLQNDLENTRSRLQQITGERDELSQKLDASVKETQKSIEMQARLQTRADRAEEALMKSESEGASSSSAIKALRAEYEGAAKQLREARIEREAAEELRAQLADRSANSKKKIDALTQERDAAKKAAADVPEKIANLQKDVEKAIKEKTDAGAKLSKTEENLKKVSKERDDALTQIEGLKDAEKQIAKLMSDNTAVMAKLADAEKAISLSKGDGAKKEQQLIAFQKDIAAAKQQLVDAQKQGTGFQQQMVEAQTKLDAQNRELAKTKADVASGTAESKKLGEEGDLLRGILVREMKEQTRREETRKQVLSQLAKLDVQSKSLLKQIEYLGQPVVKLTDKERKLFKKPLVEISGSEVSIAAPKEGGEETGTENPPEEPAPEAGAPQKATAPEGDLKPIGTLKPDAGAQKPADKGGPTADSTKAPHDGELPSKGAEEKSAVAAPNPEFPNVPPELASLALEGKKQYDSGNYVEAEKVYARLLLKAPKNLYALSNLGVVRFRSGKLKLAEEAFKEAIAIAPDDAFSLCTLGIIYYTQASQPGQNGQAKLDQAVQVLTKAVTVQPKNATAHNYLGITASQKGWQENAQKELDTAIELDPNYADAHFNLAVVYASQEPPNRENARKHYDKAVALGSAADKSLEKLLK